MYRKLVGKSVYATVWMLVLLAAGCSGGEDYDLTSYYEEMNYACLEDQDCEIKDVHNCCGFYPLCVNTLAKTDPKYVESACIEGGLVSVCGYQLIVSCRCVGGLCRGVSDDGSLSEFNPPHYEAEEIS